jgi:hypothetical protein
LAADIESCYPGDNGPYFVFHFTPPADAPQIQNRERHRNKKT